jgi:plastocyanin
MRAGFIASLTAGLAVMMAGAVFLAVPVLATTGITVTTGACSGGGTSFCFTPESASGVTGTAVSWTNQTGVDHTVTLCTASACAGAPANTGSDTFDLSLGSSSGSSAQFTFSNAGTYHYYCRIHGYTAMHGAVVVTTASNPTPTPTPSPRPTTSASSGRAAPIPTTGSAPGWPVLLLPLGSLLTLFGITLRRKH